MTAFLCDPRFLEHDTGQGHPESPERITWVLDHMNKVPWFCGLTHLTAEPTDLTWPLTVHSHDYLRRAEDTCKKGEKFLDTLDVSICRASFEIALLAVGGCLRLADEVVSGRVKNGFAFVRPPGHHAEAGRAMGFCLINNSAVTARYLQKKHKIERVLILDWDVHHGNGTQHIFDEDPGVFYASLHQSPFYPWTGLNWEAGINRGFGATINCAMPPGSGDADYQAAFETKILPAMKKFKPEAVIISSGFDAHVDDPLANICLSTECFGWMTRRLMDIADEFSGGRVISIIEGGYHPVALPQCVEEHLAVLSGKKTYG
ncbi:MAG: histone deacetylase [Candidatus Omnitrophica bacterium]|nr:histone deacetylase [Candidatus Omnitrophota bacterium]